MAEYERKTSAGEPEEKIAQERRAAFDAKLFMADGDGNRETSVEALDVIRGREGTEENFLPNGWIQTTVAEACECVSVGIVVNPSDYYVGPDVGVRTFRSGNVQENCIRDEKWVYISAEGNKKNKKSILASGDVLVVRTGFAGTACVVPPLYAGSNCIDILFARPHRKHLTPEYLCQLTNSPVGRRQVFSGKSGLAQKHLNVSTFKKMSFGLPAVREQERIAAVLTTWDKAIAAAQGLLANSLKQRHAVIQQILTGKRRLKSFSSKQERRFTPHGTIPADWSYARIESIAEEVSEKHWSEFAFPVLACTKYAGLVDSLTYFKKQVFSKDLSTYKVVPRGCFVYATNHIEEGSIGYQDRHDFGLVSPMYTVFKTSPEVHNGYLYRLLKTEHFRQIFAAATNSSVDRRGSLRWKDFKKLRVPLPALPEQTAIAVVLTSADREIILLESRLASFRAEKTALMQQLLTGKRRVRLEQFTAAKSL